MLHNHRSTAVGLILVGAFLLFVSNGIFVGWGNVWPVFLVGGGIAALRYHRVRRAPELMFLGITLTALGAFFAAFTLGFLDWTQMSSVWPAIPMIVGASLVITAVRSDEAAPTIILGIGVLVFGVVGTLFEVGAIESRVATPFIRFWPLVFVLAGAVMFRLGSRQAESQHGAVAMGPRSTVFPLLESEILQSIRQAPDPDAAVRKLVTSLHDNFHKFGWVGVYRADGDMLRLGPNDFVGTPPEYTDIPFSDGICGASASARETIIVPDVCNDPRYLACSPSVKSEIVVPIVHNGEFLGVLDIDSDQLDAFDRHDREFLEGVVAAAAPFLSREAPTVQS